MFEARLWALRAQPPDMDEDAFDGNPATRYPGIDPIRIRDPVAEVLGVRERGQPFAVGYPDLVRAAGHSCPTAAGAYRIADLGLAALYSDELPVRGEVAVRVGGPRDETAFGVTGRLLSLVTGAAGDDGFGGLPGGFGRRRGLLTYEPVEGSGVRVRLSRAATDEAVEVVYDVDAVPGLGDAKRHLPAVVDGNATVEATRAFREAWHGRVDAVLSSEAYFSVEERA